MPLADSSYPLQQDVEFRAYVQEAAGSQRSADQLADLRDRGVITAEEFEREKARVLGGLTGCPTGRRAGVRPGLPQVAGTARA